MARAIGVDIGDHTIKVVELSGSARSFKVQRVAIRPVPGEVQRDEIEITDAEGDDEAPPPPSREERISETLREIYREMALPKEDTCSSFHARNSMIREITVPFFDDDQIRKIVRFEAENHLHSQAIDDVVVNWVKTGETKDGSRLTIFASPKDRLAASIATLRRAGVDPAAVDLDATALYTALDAAGLIATYPTCVVLHVGATSTNLILVVEGRPRVFRAFPLGTGALEAALAHQLGAGAGRSHGAARKDDLFVTAGDRPAPAGTPEAHKSLAQVETDLVTDEREAFVNKLHREVIRSLAAVRTEAPPERLLLTGGGALLEGVDEALAARFGLPVERLDILDHVETKDRGSDPAYAGAALGPAIGCALRMLGRNPLGIELLRDEFAPRNTFDVIRTALATALTLGFLLIAALAYSAKQELRAEEAKFNEKFAVAEFIFKEAESQYLQKVEAESEEEARLRVARWIKQGEGDPRRITRMAVQLGRRLDFLRDQMGLSEKIPPLPSALEAWVAFYAALQAAERSDLGQFRIERMSIRTRQLQATILADSTAAHEKARQLIEASPYFQKRAKNPRAIVELGSSTTETTTQGDMKKQEYTISFGDED